MLLDTEARRRNGKMSKPETNTRAAGERLTMSLPWTSRVGWLAREEEEKRVGDWAQRKRTGEGGANKLEERRMRKRQGQSGNERRGSAGGKRDIRARGSRTKRMGREGKQEGKRWEGSHEWRQPGEGDRGHKSRESEWERDIGGRGPVEFRARYAIWRYRGQRLVRNTKLFMNGRKLSLKL